MKIGLSVVVIASLGYSACTTGADVVAGRQAFKQQCALCHSAEPGDDGGARGPSLHGVFGRKAAGDDKFTYTAALRNSGLTWDAPTLDRFLAAPTSVVPGTSMVNAVAIQSVRQDLVAYFRSVKNVSQQGAASASAPAGGADWKNDKPGRVHHVTVESLPAPFATAAASNSVDIIARPKDAKLSVPPGFKVDVFASDLDGPRLVRVAPNGDVFVSEQGAGRIMILRPSADGTKAASVETYARGLREPFGMRFYPAGDDPKWLYVAELNRVVRYPYSRGDLKASGTPQEVVPQLSPGSTGGHSTRDIAFSLDGKRLFVSVGSQSNVADDMPKKSPQEIREWDAQHGVGAAWDTEANRAAVLVFDLETQGPLKMFATGIRNCVGLTVQPVTGEVWCTTNERDNLGDDLVPDYSTRVKQGGYYGWPWYYLGNHEDPRRKGERPDLAGKAIVPDVLYTAHSAALNLTFYTATSGKSAFPSQYVGDGFAVLHGSWNRAHRTGHKVVRVLMKNNVPTGQYEDFLTGFIVADDKAWGRPVSVDVASDGSLLMSDDDGGNIFRISYSR